MRKTIGKLLFGVVSTVSVDVHAFDCDLGALLNDPISVNYLSDIADGTLYPHLKTALNASHGTPRNAAENLYPTCRFRVVFLDNMEVELSVKASYYLDPMPFSHENGPYPAGQGSGGGGGDGSGGGAGSGGGGFGGGAGGGGSDDDVCVYSDGVGVPGNPPGCPAYIPQDTA